MLFTVSTEQLIKDFYVLGSALKVAEKYGVAHQTIYSRFSDMGFDCRPERFDIIASITKEMLEKDYDEYGQCSAIAKKYGVSRETITRYGCGQMHYAGNGIVSKIAKYLYQDATIFLPRKYDIIKDLLK